MGLGALAGRVVMLHPFPLATVSSSYGRRIHPETGRLQHHDGTDYKVPAGSDVHAIAPGHVVAVRWDDRLGNVIEVDHGAGYRSRYAHLIDPGHVAIGDYVDTSSRIGNVGKSGSAARGYHLHLELWHHGTHIDPAKNLNERPS